MVENIVAFIIGIVCIVFGCFNMRGNLSLIHSYHRHRVSEEDKKPFGKQVGLGNIIIGIGMIMFSILRTITLYTKNNIFSSVGAGVLIGGFVIGVIVSFHAMIKYNKGIF